MEKLEEIDVPEETSSTLEAVLEDCFRQTVDFLSRGGGRYFAENSGFCPQDLWTQDEDPA